MLLKINRRYRKSDVKYHVQKFALFLKKNDSRKSYLFGYYDTKEDAIYQAKRMLGINCDLSEDFRIKMITETYEEQEISVPTSREVEERIPELKGVFL